MKQHEGKFEMPSTAKTGINKNKKPYTQWKHKIGGRLFSSFKGIEDLGLIDQTYYIVAYEESPNPAYPDNPYKNLKNITPATAPEVTQEEMKEENEKVNLVPAGTEPKAIDETINEYNFGAFFGMCSNQTMKFIIHQLKANPDPEGQANWSYQKKFSQIFDIIWEENIKKRKEKLE